MLEQLKKDWAEHKDLVAAKSPRAVKSALQHRYFDAYVLLYPLAVLLVGGALWLALAPSAPPSQEQSPASTLAPPK